MSMRHINLLSKNMEKIELMEELQVHYKDFVKRMKGRVSYDDYETQSLLEGYTEELASFISKELDKAREEGNEELSEAMIKYLENMIVLVGAFNPMSEVIKARQEGELEAYKGILSKLKQ